LVKVIVLEYTAGDPGIGGGNDEALAAAGRNNAKLADSSADFRFDFMVVTLLHSPLQWLRGGPKKEGLRSVAPADGTFCCQCRPGFGKPS